MVALHKVLPSSKKFISWTGQGGHDMLLFLGLGK